MEPDRLRWRHSSEGSFTVNKLYKRENNIMQEEELKIWRNVWKNIAPTKVKCFTWLVVRKACLTHEVLQKKGRVVVTRCFLCNETRETNNHLFLHCKFTAQLWNMFFSLTKTVWTMLEHTADLMSCWMKRRGSKSKKKWWRIIPSCIWWSVWRKRNGRCFEDKIRSVHDVKWNCLETLFFWCKQNCIEEIEELVEFVGAL
ncbi:hypothetical protein AABB24_004516 [Solanum stoloniferum]|uniref:Reverse transcriptase zinc-binding domain-containing protein n=1 Tax=Solanum stoloniferum TaxID=62892 RepID=A0ABD2VE39_9SOLN